MNEGRCEHYPSPKSAGSEQKFLSNLGFFQKNSRRYQGKTSNTGHAPSLHLINTGPNSATPSCFSRKRTTREILQENRDFINHLPQPKGGWGERGGAQGRVEKIERKRFSLSPSLAPYISICTRANKNKERFRPKCSERGICKINRRHIPKTKEVSTLHSIDTPDRWASEQLWRLAEEYILFCDLFSLVTRQNYIGRDKTRIFTCHTHSFLICIYAV